MSKTIWNRVEKLTTIDFDATHTCVGMCSVSNRSHYSKKKGFQITHAAYNCNGKIMYKGHCAGHLLNRQATPAVVADDSLKMSAEWIAVEVMTDMVMAAVKIRAEIRATKLRHFSDVRSKLRKKAPKSHVARFNWAVRRGLWDQAKSLANRYGVRV